jgi:DHA1 family bicyclomycin/chloramphenicol resistance-like MFS transporter
MIRGGFALMALAALVNLGYSGAFTASVPWAVLPILVYTFGLALVLPPMTIMTLELYPQMRGLAASLQNFVQMLLFALVSAFVAPMLYHSAFLLAAGMAGGMVLSWLCWRLAAPPGSAVTADPVGGVRSSG